METMQRAPVERSRWFGGLRRSRSRLLGGVAAGFADFWAVDPLLVRVVLASPLIAAVFALLTVPFWDGFAGAGLLLMELLWLAAGAVAIGYLLAWVLIPQPGVDSLARRLLGLQGAAGGLVKLVVGAGLVLLLGWLAFMAIALFGPSLVVGTIEVIVLLGVLVVVTVLVLLIGWLGRGGDARDAVRRVGSPGFGRTEAEATGGWSDPTDGTTAGTATSMASGTADGDPTVVLHPDATTVYPAPDTTTALPPADPTTAFPAPADTVAFGRSTPASKPRDAVDRARAAAVAEADARAAATEAERRLRAEQNRARRAAARAVRKERNRWGRLVAAVTLIAGGVLFLTDRVGATTLGALGIGVVCLGLLATGVLVGAWFGSARWLIAPALMLAAVLAAGAFVTTTLERAADAPAIAVAPDSLAENSTTAMQWDSGNVTIDLTDARELSGRALYAQVGSGSLTVVVPADQWVEVSTQVVLGNNSLASGNPPVLSSSYSSFGHPDDPASGDEMPLYLDMEVRFGDLHLIREES